MLEKLSESDSFSGEHRQVMIWVWTLLQAACGGREPEESARGGAGSWLDNGQRLKDRWCEAEVLENCEARGKNVGGEGRNRWESMWVTGERCGKERGEGWFFL